MMTESVYHGAEVSYSGTWYTKDAVLAIKKSGGAFYTGWVLSNATGYPHDTFFPITSNYSVLPRAYSIDISRYV
jgi:hypothetical protein